MPGSTVVPIRGTALVRPVIAYTVGHNRYLNITSRCNLRCDFCPKTQGTWELHGQPLRLYREPSVSDVIVAAGDPSAYDEVIFCGLGEPTLRLYDLLEIARDLRQKGGHICVTTDGLANRLYARDITPDFEDNVDALSISLNAHDPVTYERHCCPPWANAFDAVVDFVRRARDFVPDVTVTAIEGIEDVDIGACRRLAGRLHVAFRLRSPNDWT